MSIPRESEETANQEVTIRIFIHRIDMKIVERRRLCTNIRNGVVSLVYCNVVASIPGEHHFLSKSVRTSMHKMHDDSTYICVDIDFLEDVLEDPSIRGATKLGQVCLLRCVDCDQGMIFWSDEEFMEIPN